MTSLPPDARRIRPDPLFHWVMLALAAGVIGMSFILRLGGEDQVLVPILDQPLPGMCTYKRWLGISCPGCGLTRSFISLAHGDMSRAWHFNPAGVLFFAVVAAQIPYRSLQIWQIRRGRSELRTGWLTHIILGSFLVGMIAQWLWRLLA